ncbi:hypothetical protein [Aeromicrobium sp. UC242_57]|uniref:hypothetical protein n=1 Tax=Aeromicrobium sp. UC242_57 TaxID=3374624 RepID=UPI0037999882
MTTRFERVSAVRALAHAQNGVLSRRQILALGLTRWDIAAEVRAGRWKQHHRQTICIHTGPLDAKALRWHAVIEAGTRAVLDGTGSLLAAGLTGFDVDLIRVSIPRGAKVLRSSVSDVRQTRRLRPDDVVKAGIPRVRTPIAAIRAALWAVSDRQAALILTMTVQQRLATAEQVAQALLDVRRDRRRRFLERVVLDLLGGVESLGELDVATMCRQRGLPVPDRQAVRRAKDKKYYLDVFWTTFRLVLEIDGIHHTWATSVVDDALRQNDLSLQSLTVLRLPLLGLRVAEDAFFTQVEQALRAAGWVSGRRLNAR